MIVRNEAETIKDCLESVRTIANQIVVLDTGSTDDTIGIAKALGAEVHSFPWKDDFSAARNESIKYATGDWIFWLDADERLQPDSKKALKKCLVKVSVATAFLVTIKSIKPDGRNASLSDGHRLFSNHFGIQFSGRIHEQIAPSVSNLGGIEKPSEIVLDHLGYSYTGKKAEAKRNRNESLLLRYVKENPKSAYAHFTLAQHYSLYKDFRKAASHFKKTMKLGGLSPKMTTSAENIYAETLIHLGKMKEAAVLIGQSINRFPNQVGAYFLKYKIAVNNKDIPGQLKMLETMVTQTNTIEQEGKTLSTDVVIPVRDLEYYILRIGMDLEAPETVEKYANRMRVRLNLSYREREVLGRYYLTVGEWDFAESQLKAIYHDQPENTIILELLGLLYLKQKKFGASIHYYTLCYRLKPNDPNLKRRLAGLYAKVGQTERAEALLEEG